MRKTRGQGFTQIELIVVLIILGVLAAITVPRMVGGNAFDSRGFTDQTVVALQFARQQAVAQRRTVCATITANQVAITQSSAFGALVCNQNLTNPATNQPYAIFAPNGVTFSGPAFPFALTFNASGQPSTGLALRVNGDTPRDITVEAVTGYVHQP